MQKVKGMGLYMVEFWRVLSSSLKHVYENGEKKERNLW
jgi:hypothetical protein